ncbi:nucleotidyltransferase family protein [Paenibacillus aceris]|uniref:Nucleotidyltransferase family protein n=1 Tax=Paenibacillus aceris TaxID=869555 RepID=A0ABS4I7Y6_9BACL|nr:nucleotidyltransferase family protein [Paenibacillus aceris]MBP1967045.1 hypothetical protein [Paenibacillus aceris]NHW33242.1 nucleotidyltransferase family protein [Paenibacillus aceris]
MIIPLIQALYDPRNPLPQGMEFFEKALEDEKFSEISSQIYWLLKQRGQLERTPSFFQERLREKYEDSLCKNLFIRNQMNKVLDKLEEAGIQTVPLKGTLFAEKYFGHLGARCTSDIDLLVHPFELESAIHCVKSLGYTVEQERIPSHFHWSFSKEIPDSPIPLTIELHWDLLREKTSDLKMDEFWDQATPLGYYRYIKELSDYHTFYMICLHGWKHKLSSLKYFLDIIQMIHMLQDDLNYTLLLNDTAAHRTRRRIARTLAIVYAYFPYLADTKELPSEWKVPQLWDYYSLRANKRSFKGYMQWTFHQIFDFDTVKHSLAALLDFSYRLLNRMFSGKIKKMKETVDR